ncbi:hypothetical protein A5906_14675 [Bradyrhizobium sacchari]|uniref:Uncharacterized protein n=1 Tax=Bradyrhizobium sacchari TaxID=1399419 RepID=A0A560JMG2_9BRAD|nr:hypothetical protein [Bradyrhizobium sacchari]OPY94201.1 hypothetical protein A5906_14675 [Bradyrhizobium sacchari]TWB59278.1 hypothetical protein FBZ94_105554 [Bradyrhizobium sacchari]TWB72362.1 hypothetical protein FBZ95_10677 [Bradyrhizobium sacchari]
MVADREQVSTPEFVEHLTKASGKRSRLFAMRPALLGALLKMIGWQNTRDSLIGSLELNISRALATGWQQPPVSLDKELQLALSAQT